MDINEKIVLELQKKVGKELGDMTDDYYNFLMDKQSKEDLLKIREYLTRTRDFYKRILTEEYAKTHPNSFRYKHANNQIAKINNKGKLLKVIIEKK
jgi:hypothetical protein